MRVRMLNSRGQIAVSFFFIATIGYYLFSYFLANQRLTNERIQVNAKLKRAMDVISKYEKKYKTSHSNEQLYAQSNRDLQLNLAKQEKMLAEISVELDGEKTKLSDAFLFYTDIKSLIGALGQKDSHEKKVEPDVVKMMKRTVSDWKVVVDDNKVLKGTHAVLSKEHDKLKTELDSLHMLKKNHTKLSKEHDKLKTELDSLHMSHRSLQRANVNTSIEFSSLNKMYRDLLVKYKNATGLYNMQLAIGSKLQKEVDGLKLNQSKKKSKGKRKAKKGYEGNVNRTSVLSTGNRSIAANNAEKNTSPKESLFAKQTKDSVSVQNSKKNLSFVHNKKSNSGLPASEIPLVVPFVSSGHDKKKSNPVSHAPLVSPLQVSTNKNSPSVTLMDTSMLHVNKTEHLGNQLTNVTLAKVKDAVKPTKGTAVTESDEVREYLEAQKAHSAGDFDKHPGGEHVIGDFDNEEKYDPPHVVDPIDENGLSQRATAD